MLPSYQYWARKVKNDYLALALSNRASPPLDVSGQAAAANDLKRAAAARQRFSSRATVRPRVLAQHQRGPGLCRPELTLTHQSSAASPSLSSRDKDRAARIRPPV